MKCTILSYFYQAFRKLCCLRRLPEILQFLLINAIGCIFPLMVTMQLLIFSPIISIIGQNVLIKIFNNDPLGNFFKFSFDRLSASANRLWCCVQHHPFNPTANVVIKSTSLSSLLSLTTIVVVREGASRGWGVEQVATTAKNCSLILILILVNYAVQQISVTSLLFTYQIDFCVFNIDMID